MTEETSSSGGGDRGAWLMVSHEGIASLLESPEDFTAVMLPLCRWFMGLPFERPAGLRGTVFEMMQSRQIRSLALRETRRDAGKKKSDEKTEAARANGLKGGRPRKDEPNRNPTETQQKPITETETETEPKLDKTETEPKPRAGAREPASASVSFSDSVDSIIGSASADALERITTDELIRRAADAIGDSKPSTSRWRDFIERQGKAAFCRAVREVRERMRTGTIDNGGKYLNALLNKYGQPEAAPPTPAPPAAPKPRTWTRADWALCEERCARFDAKKGCCPYSRTPPEHAAHPHPPEECQCFGKLPATDEAAPPLPSIAELAKGIAKPATGGGA